MKITHSYENFLYTSYYFDGLSFVINSSSIAQRQNHFDIHRYNQYVNMGMAKKHTTFKIHDVKSSVNIWKAFLRYCLTLH